MMKVIQIATLTAASLALSACAMDESMYRQEQSMSRQGTSAAESACMAAVNSQYGGRVDRLNVISSERSEAGSLVMVAGGPNRERWRCLASNDGEVEELSLDSGGGSAAQSSSTGELVGMRARNLDSEMAQRGFSNVGGYKSGNSSFTTWWNADSRECLSVETSDGRVANIESIAEGNCR
jgi:hypothetical protein